MQIKKFSENHYVSESGRIFKELQGKIDSDGYASVSVMYKGKRRDFFKHRLVATVFHPNPENKATVNHKDGNKLNNHMDNLEWMHHWENCYHAINTGLMTGDVVKDPFNEIDEIFKRHLNNEKGSDIAIAMNIPRSRVYETITGRRFKEYSTRKGYLTND